MLTLGLILALAAAEPAATTPQTVPATEAKPKKERKVCRDMGSTGSRMSKKKCMTAAEWLAHDNAAQMDIDGIK